MTRQDRLLDEAVRRIVAEAAPSRVLLFGSTARGETSAGSDLDLLVVMPDGADRLRVAYRLHRCLRRLGIAKDIIVVCESDVIAHRDNPSLIIHTALTEGREVYHAA